MSEELTASRQLRWPVRTPVAGPMVRRMPDARRRLQLVLAFIWLLDGALQYQSYMFTPAFGHTLAATAAGNPWPVADPINWAASIIERAPAATNAAFATVQLLLGLGIAWRPTVRPALAASVGWALSVWWFGEGLGGVLTGSASPVGGAPGAVVLYALAAVLLWPTDGVGHAAEPFTAARVVGARTARGLWLVLWGSLAYLQLQPANTTPNGLHDMVAGMADGEPGWLAALIRNGAAPLAGNGLAASLVLAVVFAVIGLGVFLPPPAARATLILAIVVSALIWVVGQAMGVIFTGQATDVNTGPLLILLATAYWPKPTPSRD